MTELLLIRHGETDYNRELRFQGQVDVPLNATGQAQARRLAQRLADEPLDLLVSSDLRRAQATAEPLLALRPGGTLHTDRGWREQGFGVLDGMVLAEARRSLPQAFELWAQHEPDLAPPGGESPQHFNARVMATLQALLQAHAGARIAVFTHGGVLDMVWRRVHELPLTGPRACAIPNTGINRLRWTGARLELLQWGDAAHLDQG